MKLNSTKKMSCVLRKHQDRIYNSFCSRRRVHFSTLLPMLSGSVWFIVFSSLCEWIVLATSHWHPTLTYLCPEEEGINENWLAYISEIKSEKLFESEVRSWIKFSLRFWTKSEIERQSGCRFRKTRTHQGRCIASLAEKSDVGSKMELRKAWAVTLAPGRWSMVSGWPWSW